MSKIQIYNSPQEVGVRILFILDICQKRMSKQRIMFYDYFALHLNDLDHTKESLHPDNPNHSSEIAIKRELISRGLDLIIAKGLLSVKYSKTGIYYCPNRLTDKQIYKYINQNIGKWTGEFEYLISRGGE